MVGRPRVLHLMCKGSSRMYQLRCVLPSAITTPFPAPQSKGTGTSPRGPRAQPVTRTRETLPGRGCLSLEQAGRLKGPVFPLTHHDGMSPLPHRMAVQPPPPYFVQVLRVRHEDGGTALKIAAKGA